MTIEEIQTRRIVRPDNIRHTHFSRNPKIAQYLKAYKYVILTPSNNQNGGTVNVLINVPISVSVLATSFDVSEKTIKRDLYVLRDLNLIRYVGSNKTGHWKVVVKE